METSRTPESASDKLRQELEELLGQARNLEPLTRAPASLPRVQEPTPVAVPLHESILPGSVLISLFRDPKTGRTVSFKREELAQLDDMSADYLLKYYESQSVLTSEDAARLRNCIESLSRRLYLLSRRSDWRAGAFAWNAVQEQTVLRCLLQLQLMVECLEIVTPPLLTVKQISGEEFDLIDDVREFVRLTALVLWERLAAPGVDEQAYGVLAACLILAGCQGE